MDKYIPCFNDEFLAEQLLKAVDNYLDSKIVINTIQKILEKKSTPKKSNTKFLSFCLQIKI